ncbi:hypothetical protein [Hazenella coriacea]|uniref:Uncharacterized protein n=1 Tax=Hazenella coriacea TaxID=1179467 RepID=A0A4R3L4Y8_9BACL|nr:hypothetical protein [Hazenella coriacea]TCS94679.1 hypothetical protein EDD58_10391 [Hazenella coriacea]
MKPILISSALSIIYPGLGQMYNRQIWKAVLLFLVCVPMDWINFMKDDLVWEWRLLFTLVAVIDAGYTAWRITQDSSRSFLTVKQSFIRIGISVVILAFCTLGLRFAFIQAFNQAVKEQQNFKVEDPELNKEVTEYLEEKYQQEFEILKTNTFVGEYDILAAPKGQPDVKFSVSGTSKENFIDTYYSALWSKQVQKNWQPVIDQTFGITFDNKIDITTNSMEIRQRKVENGKMPHVSEVLQKDSYQITPYIKINIIQNFNRENKEEQLEKVLSFVQMLQSQNVTQAQVDIKFYDEVLKKTGTKNYSKVKHMQNFVLILDDEFLKIKTVEDLEERLGMDVK